MNKPIWFKRKTYGWGWYPATWQGWLTLLAFAVLMIANAVRLSMSTPSHTGTILTQYIPQTILLVVVLLVVCYLTGETPRWQWGEDKKSKTS